MKKQILAVLAAAVSFTLAVSCQKTLELDYDETDPLLVVDGQVNNEEIFVRLYHHSNMVDTMNEECLRGAEVTIEGSDGYAETLVYSDGAYVSPTNAVGTPGVTYTLRVKHGQHECSAESTMPEPVAIDSVRWEWMPIMSDVEIRMLYVYLTDDRDTENYYGLYLKRGKNVMKRAIASDLGLEPPFNYFSWGITSKNRMEEEDKERRRTGKRKKDVLYAGDKIVLSLRSVNWDSYHYLSMVGDNSDGINPESNLKGDDCVGYFTAYGVSKVSLVFPDIDE